MLSSTVNTSNNSRTGKKLKFNVTKTIINSPIAKELQKNALWKKTITIIII